MQQLGSGGISRVLGGGIGLVLILAAHWSGAGAELEPDDVLRRRAVGVWEDQYQGRRTLTMRADGTATMVVELEGWKAVFYAARLRFEMTWTLESGRLKKHTTSGEPAGKVNAILKMFGDRVDEAILELSDDRLLLLDQNGKRRYDWRRVPPSRNP